MHDAALSPEQRRALLALTPVAARGFRLSAALAAFEARFASASPDLLHRVKALTYFEDAEREPDLRMLKPIEWSQVRAFFEREVLAWWQTSAG
jgi:hypothetical protein